MKRVREIRLMPKTDGGWEEGMGAFVPVETLEEALVQLDFQKSTKLPGVEELAYEWDSFGQVAYSILRVIDLDNSSATG